MYKFSIKGRDLPNGPPSRNTLSLKWSILVLFFSIGNLKTNLTELRSLYPKIGFAPKRPTGLVPKCPMRFAPTFPMQIAPICPMGLAPKYLTWLAPKCLVGLEPKYSARPYGAMREWGGFRSFSFGINLRLKIISSTIE